MKNKKNVPDVRFKGFADEWNNEALGKLATFSKGRGYSKGDLVEKGTPIVLYGRLYTKYQTVISDVDTFAIQKKDSVLSKGIEVVVPASGETAEDISRASVIIKPNTIIAGDLNIIYPNSEMDSVFLALSISNGDAQKNLSKKAQGKSVVHLHNSDLDGIELKYPVVDEQKAIGNYFQNIDRLINTSQTKLDKLKNIKKACLEKMFPRNGSTTPELRFKGFTEEWIIKKFGTCVLIQRGGSPRPIEEFITDDENGINWIKIGDVSTGSRYITSTNEKIKPEGESKSRRVEKGDLILSNSMSFGRPYIMQIDGCIHDGWLLIRNDKGIFDLEYLLQMLSSDYMLTQYKSLASGGVVNNLNSELVQSTTVQIANVNEQIRIGFYFKNLDDLIAKTEQQINKLKNIKKACLDKMFVNE